MKYYNIVYMGRRKVNILYCSTFVMVSDKSSTMLWGRGELGFISRPVQIWNYTLFKENHLKLFKKKPVKGT